MGLAVVRDGRILAGGKKPIMQPVRGGSPLGPAAVCSSSFLPERLLVR